MPISRTTFGPTVIELRGAGAKGHDPHTIGAGTQVGLDVRIPVNQTANAIQVSQPDGTVIWAIGPTVVQASGALPVTGGNYIITAGSAQALTLAAPTQNGATITIRSASAFAHTLTATGLLQTGTAAVNVATFAAFAGASLTLVAYSGHWMVQSSNGVTFT